MPIPSRHLAAACALLALSVSPWTPTSASAADDRSPSATPIRLEAGTPRQRKALAGSPAEGIAEGDFAIARIDVDGDGVDETVVQGRARLWCNDAGCSTMVLKGGGARSSVLLDANLPRSLGVAKPPGSDHRALVGLDGSGRIAIGDRQHGRLYGRPLVFPLRERR